MGAPTLIISGVYHGSVAVAFNGNPFFGDLARNGVPWIHALDFIGLDCYWPIITDLGRRTSRPGGSRS